MSYSLARSPLRRPGSADYITVVVVLLLRLLLLLLTEEYTEETHGKGNLPVGQTAPGWGKTLPLASAGVGGKCLIPWRAPPCVCRGRRIYIYIHDIFGPIIIQLVLRRTGAWLRRTGA